MGVTPRHRPDEEGVVHLPPAIGVGHPSSVRGEGGLAHRPPEGVIVHGHAFQPLGCGVPDRRRGGFLCHNLASGPKRVAQRQALTGLESRQDEKDHQGTKKKP